MPLPSCRIYLNPEYQPLFIEIANKYENVEFLDLHAELKHYDQIELDTFEYEEGHYNDKGHKAIGKALANFMGEYKRIKFYNYA